MVKKISIYLVCCVCISAYAMKPEKQQRKDIYKLSELEEEVVRVREQYRNKSRVPIGTDLKRGIKIDHDFDCLPNVKNPQEK